MPPDADPGAGGGAGADPGAGARRGGGAGRGGGAAPPAPAPGSRGAAELEQARAFIEQSPREQGRLELVVARPAPGERRVLERAVLDPSCGLAGDGWSERRGAADAPPEPDRQLTLMNHRVALVVAGAADRVPLAGDQLYVDLDLSVDHLPPGSRLAIGAAVVELTEPPHTGCAKFTERFGLEALRFVNSEAGRRMRLRGANARVVVGGEVAAGDAVRRLPTG